MSASEAVRGGAETREVHCFRFKESSVRAHQIWVPLENVRFLLLSTNLAREWLHIGTHLLRIITA